MSAYLARKLGSYQMQANIDANPNYERDQKRILDWMTKMRELRQAEELMNGDLLSNYKLSYNYGYERTRVEKGYVPSSGSVRCYNSGDTILKRL